MAKPKNVIFFFTIHNILSKDAFEVNRLSLWVEKLTYKKKQAIIGVSQEVLNDYNTWVGIKGKSFVLYDYVNEIFFLAEAGSARTERPVSPVPHCWTIMGGSLLTAAASAK